MHEPGPSLTTESPDDWQQDAKTDAWKQPDGAEPPLPPPAHEPEWDAEDVATPDLDDIVWDDLTAAQREAVESMSAKDRDMVKKAHAQLGHCGSSALARVLRLAGATDTQVHFSKAWRCRICASRKAPGYVNQASGFTRPIRFNALVALDLKECKDINNNVFWFLNILDIATRYIRIVGHWSPPTTSRSPGLPCDPG